MFLRYIFGAYVSRLIMPAQNNHVAVNSLQNIPDVNLQYLRVNSTHNASIHFCEIKHTTLNQPLNTQKVIIHAEGNFQRFETFIDDYVNEAKRHKDCTIVGLNYRNVGESRGIATSENDWIDDVVSVVNYYRNRGVPTENILLCGYSLSGAILTMAAATMYAKDKAQNKHAHSVKLINNRSFSDLPEMMLSLFLGGWKKTILNTFIYTACIAWYLSWPMTLFIGATVLLASAASENIACHILKPWIKLCAWLTFGTLNAIAAYQSLPESAKDYVVAKNDRDIQQRPSLHLALKTQRRITKKRLNDSMVGKPSDQLNKIRAELKNMKDSKLVGDVGINEHLAPLSYLRTHHRDREQAISGEQVLDNKIKRLLISPVKRTT